MSIYSGFFTSDYSETAESASGVKRKAEYLFYTETQSNDPANNGTQSTSNIQYSPTVTGAMTFGSYYILLNTLIPISLVVSIEFVKLIQTPFIAHDMEMYDEEQLKQA